MRAVDFLRLWCTANGLLGVSIAASPGAGSWAVAFGALVAGVNALAVWSIRKG